MASEAYSFEFLRELARLQAVEPTDADLAGVQTFLTNILPALADIERGLPDDVVPVGERVPAA